MKSAMVGFWSAGGGCGVAIVDVVSVVVEEDGGGGGDSEDEDEDEGSCADKGTDTGLPCVDTGTEEMGLCCGDDDDDGIPGLTVSVLAFDNDRLTFTRPKGCDGLFCAAYAFRTEKVMMEPTRLARVPLPPPLAPPSLPAVSTPSPLTPTSLIALPCRPFGSPLSVIVPILVLLLLLFPVPVPGNRGTDTDADTVLSLRRRDASVRSADESDLEREGTGEGAGAGANDVDVDDVSRLGTEDEDIDVDVDADGVKYVSGARAALSRPRELSTFSARRSECDRWMGTPLSLGGASVVGGGGGGGELIVARVVRVRVCVEDEIDGCKVKLRG